MKKRKSALSFALAASMALSLLGCGSGSTPSSESAKDNSKSVKELTMWYQENQAMIPAMEQRVADFNKTYEGQYHLNIEFIPRPPPPESFRIFWLWMDRISPIMLLMGSLSPLLIISLMKAKKICFPHPYYRIPIKIRFMPSVSMKLSAFFTMIKLFLRNMVFESLKIRMMPTP